MPTLGVRLLGEFALDGTDLSALRSRKARALLKVLALAGGATVSADALVDAVWGGALPADPTGDLSVLVSRARKVVGGDRLVRRGAGYALLVDWSDREQLRVLAREASRRLAAGDVVGARTAAGAALALVRGDLLADEPDAEWAVAARLQAAADVADVRACAARAALASGQPADAAAHARAALAHDPFDEAALRVLMSAHVAAGRPASALAEYAAMRERLADELGVDPDSETEALHTAVLLGGPARGAEPDAGVRSAPVGRVAELRLLDEALRRSRGRAEVVAVRGEAGAGKTHLLQAWADAARANGTLVLWGTADEGHVVALQPVLDALANHVPGEDASLARMARLGGATAPTLPGPAGSGGSLQAELFDGMCRLLDGLAEDLPLAVVLDDAHLADPVTLAWTSYVLRRRHQHRWMVVAACRSGEGSTVRSSCVIDVGPLDIESVAELVGIDRAGELWRRSGGNALLLVELAGAPPGALPATVREAVAERLGRTGPAAGTLRAAAVLGPSVDLDLLAGVLDASPIELLEHLDEGVRRSFLGERDGVLVFRHDLVRESIAADCTGARRAYLHREAARVLAQRPGANPMDIAWHARRGGDPVLAARGLVGSADLACERLDLVGAEALLDEAVTLHDDASTRLPRSRVRMARADLAGADSDAEAALGSGGGAKALEMRAWAARYRHDMESAIRLGEAGAAMAVDAATRASCLLAVAFAHRGIGDLPAADRTLAAAAAAGPPASLGLAAWIGVLRVHQGRPAEALEALQPLVGAGGGGLHSFWVEHVLQMCAHAFGAAGKPAEAMRVLDRFDAELERRDSRARYGGAADAYRSWILRNLAVPEAADAARRAMERGASAEIRAQARLDLADVLLMSGRVDEAMAEVAVARDEQSVRWFHNRWRCEQRSGLIAARAHLASGTSAEALAAAAAVVVAAEHRGDARYATLARLARARAEARARRPVDRDEVMADVARLREVAALEACWWAADVADDTGVAGARAAGLESGRLLVVEAGPHADVLRVALARRFS